MAGVIISATVNVSRQFSALVEAKKMNQNLSMKVDDLKNVNNELTNQVIYASSSSYLEEAAIDKFGLGSENDVWLELFPEPKMEQIISANIDDFKPKYQQWFDLFTK